MDSPVDVFAEVERRLTSQFNAEADGFALAREDAERAARIHHGNFGAEDITFDEIYEHFALLWKGNPQIVAEGRQLELAVETELLVAVPDTLALIAELRRREIPFMFVSDMYLPVAFVAERLVENGFAGWSELLMSGHAKVTKSTGAVWPVVGAPDRRILHIGDDHWADYTKPRDYGVTTLLYSRAKSERRVGAPLTPALLPFSRAQRLGELAAREDAGKVLGQEATARQLGEALGVLVVGTYVRWLDERLRRHKIDRVYFCARDGWLIQRAWRAAGLDYASAVTDSYLYIARRPLNLACGYLDSTPKRLSSELIDFLSTSDGIVTVDTVLKRAGLDGIPGLVADARQEIGPPDTPLLWKAGHITTLHSLLQRHASEVHAILKPAYDSILGYLEQEGLFADGKVAMIDMGWNGTMQRSLRKVGRSVRTDFEIAGFYYGLWPTALANRFAAGYMEAAFANEFQSFNEQSAVHGAVELLEELHSAPHGTVRGYEREGNGWKPALADSPGEKQQYQSVTRHFQDGVVEGIAELFNNGSYRGLTIDDLTVENAKAALAAVILSPSSAELDMLATLGHCSTFDHAAFNPVFPNSLPASPEERMAAFQRTGWRLGMLRHWRATGGDVDRQIVNEFARSNLAHLGERVLRQFW
ncbi:MULTISPECIES: hypothetical protein [unclassified Chelatococcus]|uniref:hypothetical protein n=1 Tax=unclassified Chelatococcus TaxID=2638111 RepID=UPI001BCDA668|nr:MULTISPECIES: hypothetical protein [unclassified Chelatococcus]MBS7695782.1 hypothetical protein [Chelatococcus sp. YT9]MBX3555843.1 hypothetical protein [Chelatococcus sp.]